ncbi:hydroxymethylglutaryl-CoA synthase [Candidatus Peregrinibacteria bacterium CG10_big_fil_rev_8_21_14_0_10_49_16]|nr:MAG: hydroxymethylglutaryl-CoA synthase [Candidatus Peregrinibacteria bacterium CG22_combo_CG10-13_8_21_14_all_49_11]PIR51965.1 MAG: hydroxymethylglutaryl-CoA synthase [Candidatus Peregrinibacteria bacterium CG10_big_fil_rev_8_21_14_0_10_49_16]
MHSVIIGFGKYLPRYRIRTEEIAKHWQQDAAHITQSLGIEEKTVPAENEDSFTFAYEAAKQAIEVANIPSSEISACFVGSESHPYAVKPTSGMLVSALELHPFSHAADLEFACKAGTAAMQIVDSFIRSKQIEYGLAIGTDRAQAKAGDALEYSAAAGAAALLLGSEKHENALCRMDHTLSFTTDTPDFWRSEGASHPEHAGRFTGEPGYFSHMRETISGLLTATHSSLPAIHHVVLHMPNAKFPKKIMKEFGCTDAQVAHGFIVPTIGNTYSACSLLGLVNVLQHAKKEERIMLVSYGSGAGCDAFLMTMLRHGMTLSEERRDLEYVSYSKYSQLVQSHQ